MSQLVDLLARCAVRPGSLRDRACYLARVLAGGPRTPELEHHPQVREALEKLWTGVTYVVLNIPTAESLAPKGQRGGAERVFVAILKPSTLAPYSPRVPMFPDGGHCDVLFVDEDRAQDESWLSEVENAWQQTWTRYYEDTAALEENGVYTWNQFLLHGCDEPSPHGLWWGTAQCEDEEAARVSPFYIALRSDLAHAVGLGGIVPSPIKEWPERLLATNRPATWDALEPQIRRAWQAMKPRSFVDVIRTPAAAIYHLIESYATWGGSAFISIPIPVAQADQGVVYGVLSVCSAKPLSGHEILRWRLVGTSAFPLLAVTDLVVRRTAERAKGEAAVTAYTVLRHSFLNHFKKRDPWAIGPDVARALVQVDMMVLDGACALAGVEVDALPWDGSGPLDCPVWKKLVDAYSPFAADLKVTHRGLSGRHVDARLVAMLAELTWNAISRPGTPSVTVEIEATEAGTVSIRLRTEAGGQAPENLKKRLCGDGAEGRRGGVNFVAALAASLFGVDGFATWSFSSRNPTGNSRVFSSALSERVTVRIPSDVLEFDAAGRLDLCFEAVGLRAVRTEQ